MRNENTQSQWDDDKWVGYFKRLKLAAYRDISSQKWLGQFTGIDPEDIALEVIADVRAGKEKWDSAHYPNLLQFLLVVQKSKIIKLAKLKRNNSELSQDDDLDETVATSKTSTEDDYEDLDFYYGFTKYIENNGKRDLIPIADLIERGYEREEIAEELGVPASKITNQKKVLKRQLRDYYMDKYGELPAGIEITPKKRQK